MNKEAELKGMIGDGDKDGYDVVVVGSGYGDSIVACRMSNAGIKVCLDGKLSKYSSFAMTFLISREKRLLNFEAEKKVI
ncbi:cholesterol oxidase-like [Fagus crenata]